MQRQSCRTRIFFSAVDLTVFRALVTSRGERGVYFGDERGPTMMRSDGGTASEDFGRNMHMMRPGFGVMVASCLTCML